MGFIFLCMIDARYVNVCLGQEKLSELKTWTRFYYSI